MSYPAWLVKRLCSVGAWMGAAALAGSTGAAAEAPSRKPRFQARVQVLSGAGIALPSSAGGRSGAAYVPLDLEWALRVAGPFSVALGSVGYLAPFLIPDCPGGGQRPNGLAAFAGVRLDPAYATSSLTHGVVAPWIALRAGVVGQDGVALISAAGCADRLAVQPWFGPRGGIDVWLGRSALTVALGYDYLPRAAAVTVQAGVTVRVF